MITNKLKAAEGCTPQKQAKRQKGPTKPLASEAAANAKPEVFVFL